MNNEFLKAKLQAVARRFQWLGLWRKLAVCWALAALTGVALIWFQRLTGWTSPLVLPALAAVAATIATALAIRHYEHGPDFRWIARKVEDKNPELDGLLLTAVQQDVESGQEPGYLQYRVLQEATARSQEQDWRQVVPSRRFYGVHGLHLAALACFVVALVNLRVDPIMGEAARWTGVDGMTVTPGDTTLERGDTLVVLAKFGQRLPAAVNLVVRENGAAARTIPLVKNMDDPVFGGSVPDVANELVYHIEYRGQKTRDFKVSVYEHPRLNRSDVAFTFPDYTRLPPKRIEDTRRVSAVEGTKLDFSLQLNKPVASAKLVARDAQKTAINLQVSPDKAVATLEGFVPEKSQSYDLQLVDAEGRANKIASPFAIDVQPNRVPELRLASPRGDVRPSALEEITFDGTVWDDFGSPAYGIAFATAGGEPKFVELGRDVMAKDKRTLGHVLRLEDLGAKPDDLISWYVWADDIGPDGKVRRTNGDLFFGEVRPFEEIFRESQEMQAGGEQGGGGGGGGQTRRLTDLQKQIINATWKLQRQGKGPKYADDAKVVHDSQTEALSQATAQAAEAPSPRQQALWKSVTQEMEKAIEKLAEAAKDPGPLAQALPAEQAALQALLKLQARETNVTRGQPGGGGGGGGGQMTQRQIDQLDLKQAQNRYETQRQARAPQNSERTEQLAVMNRLQELARRQQDLNERLKEMQTALQEAKTEQEKEEIRKRLKRLEEEQRQMLADTDEVRQRMDRAENQSSMSDQREQLDQTREDLQKAADALAQGGSVAQALAAGTKAERQLQQAHDDLRKESSSQFAEEMREMRNLARELSREQEEISKTMDALNNTGKQRRTLSDSGDRKEALDKLEQQKEKMNQLVESATQVSEQAENTEPLLHRQLYDTIRKFSQDDGNSVKQVRQELLNERRLTYDMNERLKAAESSEKSGRALDLTRELLRDGFLPEATRAGQSARNEIEEFRKGVERAAESVLGDDAEQLKLAQSELDQLTEQLQREAAQAQGRDPNGNTPGQQGDQQGARGGQLANADQQNGQQGQQDGQPGQQPGQQGKQGQGQGGQQGQQAQNQQGQDGQQGGGQQAGAQASNSQGGQGGGAQGGNDQQNAGNTDGQVQRGQIGRGQLTDGRNPQRGGNRGGRTIDDILNGGGGAGGGGNLGAWNEGRWGGGFWGGGPLMGEDFTRWAERLGDVERLLDDPEMRNAVAAALERTRQLRKEFRTDQKKPDWAVVELQVIKPLVEVRNRVAEELARRDPKEQLVRIDNDLVPNRFAEAVRKYYEELGKDK